MHRRLTGLTAMMVVFLAVLVAAAPVAASSFSYTVKINTCHSSGYTYGYGEVYYRVRLLESGYSGANKFTVDSWVQHRTINTSSWHTEYTWNRATYTFPNNSTSYYYVSTRWYDPADYAWHRIKMGLKVWHNGSVLASRTVYSKSC